MKIFHIMAGGKNGGAEVACIDLAIAMHEAGEEITVITRYNKDRIARLKQAGVRFHTLIFGGNIDVITKFFIARLIRRYKPDIIQTWMGRAAKKTPNWKALNTVSNDLPRYLVLARLGGYYKPHYFKNTDYFVVITPHLKEYLVNLGFDFDTIKPINNFVDDETANTVIARADLDTPTEATVLLALARYHNTKALDVALHALKDIPDAYLWLAGDGPEKDKLIILARTLGVQDRVKFLGWRTDRAALMQAADICIFPSRREAFGTVFVQAWQQKKPVIVSNALGPSQFCTHEQDCLMVPIEDAQALSHAVLRLQKNDALRSRLVKNGYQNYTENFTKNRCVQNYLNYYKACLEEQGIKAA